MTLFPNELAPMPYRKMAQFVAEWVQSHPQLCSSNQNRLIQQCNLYIETKGIIQKTHPDWLAFMQGLKDMQEYWFIIEVLGEKLLQPPFDKLFKSSLRDPGLPKDSKDNTPGRDTQFELFLAAIAARAGFTVERLGPGKPDWLLTASRRKWTLEAKRIKSLDKMEQHIRKAGKQITASQIGGIIAVDISLVTAPSSAQLSSYVSDEVIEEAHSRRTEFFIKDYMPSFRKWLDSKTVGFLLIHDYVIVPANDATGEGSSPWGLTGLWQRADLLNPGSSNKIRYDDFWSLFGVALPNL